MLKKITDGLGGALEQAKKLKDIKPADVAGLIVKAIENIEARGQVLELLVDVVLNDEEKTGNKASDVKTMINLVRKDAERRAIFLEAAYDLNDQAVKQIDGMPEGNDKDTMFEASQKDAHLILLVQGLHETGEAKGLGKVKEFAKVSQYALGGGKTEETENYMTLLAKIAAEKRGAKDGPDSEEVS